MSRTSIPYYAQEDLDLAYSKGGEAGIRGVDPEVWNPYSPTDENALHRQWSLGYNDYIESLHKNEREQTQEPPGNT